jgi:hypothetical protein
MKINIAACAAMATAAMIFSSRMRAEPAAPVHVQNSFEFPVAASLHDAAPLFGPNGERVWSGDEWDPQFLYPRPGSDVEGAVFRVQHGPHTSVWVNTRFDLAAGRFQYVSFVADVVVTVIDVQLEPIGAAKTLVHVVYTRTALSADGNDQVAAMGEHDRTAGMRWEKSIREYLANRH